MSEFLNLNFSIVKKYLLFISTVAMISCNFHPEPGANQPVVFEKRPTQSEPAEQTAEEVPDTTQQEYIDSFKVKMDSLMTAKITLPPIYKYEIVSGNNESAAKFSELAKLSSGRMKVLVNSDLVAKELEHTINTISVPRSDLLLLIDKTGSMRGDVDVIKQSLSQIIDTVKKYKNTRLAVAFYGDKNSDGMNWFCFRDFETDYSAAQDYINSITVGGGGDWPESVYDAVMKCMDQGFWQSTKKRNVIIIGDAPPLEKPLSDYSIEDIIARAKSSGTVMNFYPIIITPTVEAAKVEPTDLQTYQPLQLSSSVYPNPCKDVINVGFEKCDKYYIEIYDAAGQEIASEETYGLHWSKNLADVPNGFYIMRIIDPSHKFELVKFIVRH